MQLRGISPNHFFLSKPRLASTTATGSPPPAGDPPSLRVTRTKSSTTLIPYNPPKTTHQRLSELEDMPAVQSLCSHIRSYENIRGINSKQDQLNALETLFDFVIAKNEDSYNVVSEGTSYSAITVRNQGTEKEPKWMLTAGANIDPVYENMSNPEFRQCAEIQASKGFEHLPLDILILYRKPQIGKDFRSEQLTPCMDCSRRFLPEDFKGVVIVLSDQQEVFDKAGKFIKEASPVDEPEMRTLVRDPEDNRGNLYFKVFYPYHVDNFAIEKKLADSVTNGNGRSIARYGYNNGTGENQAPPGTKQIR